MKAIFFVFAISSFIAHGGDLSCNTKLSYTFNFEKFEATLLSFPEKVDINDSKLFPTFESAVNGNPEYLIALAHKSYEQRWGLNLVNTNDKKTLQALNNFTRRYNGNNSQITHKGLNKLVKKLAFLSGVPKRFHHRFIKYSLPQKYYQYVESMITHRIARADFLDFSRNLNLTPINEGSFKTRFIKNWKNTKYFILEKLEESAKILNFKNRKLFKSRLLEINFVNLLIKNVSPDNIALALKNGLKKGKFNGVEYLVIGNQRIPLSYKVLGQVSYITNELILKTFSNIAITSLGVAILTNWNTLSFVGGMILATAVYDIKELVDTQSIDECINEKLSNYLKGNKEDIKAIKAHSTQMYKELLKSQKEIFRNICENK